MKKSKAPAKTTASTPPATPADQYSGDWDLSDLAPVEPVKTVTGRVTGALRRGRKG